MHLERHPPRSRKLLLELGFLALAALALLLGLPPSATPAAAPAATPAPAATAVRSSPSP